MTSRLPMAVAATAAACALVAPAAQALTLPQSDAPTAEKRKAKPKPRYQFSLTHTRVVTIVSRCRAIPSGRTTETTTLVTKTFQRGYLGGSVSTEGWRQETLKRETVDNPHLPPYEYALPREEFSSKGKASHDWETRRGRASYLYFLDGGEELTLKLPRLNRETSKQLSSKASEESSDDRCSHEETRSLTGTVTIQRIQ